MIIGFAIGFGVGFMVGIWRSEIYIKIKELVSRIGK